MSKLSDEEVKEQLERSRRKRNLALEIAEDNEEPPTFALGRRSREIAVYTLLSGELGEAKEWFAEAADWFEEDWIRGRGENKKKAENEGDGQSYWLTQTSNLERLLYGALLTQNQELIDEAAEKVRDLDPDYNSQFPEGVHRYFHVKALAAVATDAEDQQEYMEKFKKSFSEEKPSHQRYFGAIATVLEGIVETDEELVRDGLEILIDHYDEDANDEPEGLSDRVSKRITAFVMLAQQRGIDLDIESRYIPDCILPNTGGEE